MVAYSFKKRFAPPILLGLTPSPLVEGMVDFSGALIRWEPKP